MLGLKNWWDHTPNLTFYRGKERIGSAFERVRTRSDNWKYERTSNRTSRSGSEIPWTWTWTWRSVRLSSGSNRKSEPDLSITITDTLVFCPLSFAHHLRPFHSWHLSPLRASPSPGFTIDCISNSQVVSTLFKPSNHLCMWFQCLFKQAFKLQIIMSLVSNRQARHFKTSSYLWPNANPQAAASSCHCNKFVISKPQHGAVS
jgi:hypothetical protein